MRIDVDFFEIFFASGTPKGRGHTHRHVNMERSTHVESSTESLFSSL